MLSDIKEIRLNQLKQMHNIILNINNEDIIDEWTLLLHDEPFGYIAESEGYYNECLDLFSELIKDANDWQ